MESTKKHPVRLIVVAPGMLDGAEESGFWPDWRLRWEECFRLQPKRESVHCFESQFLGLPPEFDIHAGPLAVAQHKVFPPQDAVLLALSLGSVDAGGFMRHPLVSTEAEFSQIVNQLTRLNSTRLTLIAEYGLDVGLVWEGGSISNRLVPFGEVIGQDIERNMPQGDGDRLLKTYIDDSRELLSNLDFNKSREDRELAPINIAWPWGGGLMPKLPNLPLRYGGPVDVAGGGNSIKALCRLTGASRNPIATNFKAKWNEFRPRASRSIFILDALGEAANAHQFDRIEKQWIAFVDSIRALQSQMKETRIRLSVLCPSLSDQNGVGWVCEDLFALPQSPAEQRDRIEESQQRAVWEIVDQSLSFAPSER